MLFDEELWSRWVKQEEKNYKIRKNKEGSLIHKYLKKGYNHIDPRFWFPERKNEIRKIVSNKENLKRHPFNPFLKILIKSPKYRYQKESGEYGLATKTRPICFASHLDSLIYGYLSYSLNFCYQNYIKEKKFDECVLAYRSDLEGKCNIQFAKEVFDYIKNHTSCIIIALDIKGYFDNIDHTTLKQKWCKILALEKLPDDQYRVFRSLTKYSYINQKTILKHFNIDLSRQENNPKTLIDLLPGKTYNDKLKQLRRKNIIVTNNSCELQDDGYKRYFGIPQGSPMSALLSNIYLIDFDESLNKLSSKENFLYRRYCDDILIISEPKIAFKIKGQILEMIQNYYLEIQERKVELIEFRKNSKGQLRSFNLKRIIEDNVQIDSNNEEKYYKNLQYLGFEFNGRNIYIRPSSLSRYFRKMKGRIFKTISMAYSLNSKSNKIYKQQLFHRYTHLGKKNFLKYAYNASKEFYVNSEGKSKPGLNSKSIKRQIARHFDILLLEFDKTNQQRIKHKLKRRKLKRIKY